MEIIGKNTCNMSGCKQVIGVKYRWVFLNYNYSGSGMYRRYRSLLRHGVKNIFSFIRFVKLHSKRNFFFIFYVEFARVDNEYWTKELRAIYINNNCHSVWLIAFITYLFKIFHSESMLVEKPGCQMSQFLKWYLITIYEYTHIFLST